MVIGYRSSSSVLGVRISATGFGELAPDVGNPSYSRKAYHGRLRRQTDEGEGGYGHY